MVATRGPGDLPRPHKSHMLLRRAATPHGGLSGPRGAATPSRRPYVAQGSGQAFTAAIRSPGERPCLHGNHAGPTGAATPPRQPCGAQRTGQPPRRRYAAKGSDHAPMAAIRSRGERPRHHGCHTGFQTSDHAPTAAIRGPGERPRPTATTTDSRNR